VGNGRWGRGGGGEGEADTENLGGAATQAGGCFNYFIVWLSRYIPQPCLTILHLQEHWLDSDQGGQPAFHDSLQLVYSVCFNPLRHIIPTYKAQTHARVCRTLCMITNTKKNHKSTCQVLFTGELLRHWLNAIRVGS